MKRLLIVAPVLASYTPIVLLKRLVTNSFPPENASPVGPLRPDKMKELSIVAPVVASYLPIVSLPSFATKICEAPVTGMKQSVAARAARTSAATAGESGPELDLAPVFIG